MGTLLLSNNSGTYTPTLSFSISRAWYGDITEKVVDGLPKRSQLWGTWAAQSVKHPTLDSGSGHDVTVCEIGPHVRLCADSVEPAWILSLLLSLPLLPSLFQNKEINIFKMVTISPLLQMLCTSSHKKGGGLPSHLESGLTP